MKVFLQYILLFILVSSAAYGQSGLTEYTVLGITVEGNESGSAETIIAQSSIRKGDKLTIPSDAIRRATSRVWGQNIFSDVEIEVSKLLPQSDGTTGVFLVIRVKELPKLDTVIVQGNDNLSDADINKVITFYKNDFIRPWSVDQTAKQIQALYAKEGYPYAAVRAEYEDVTDGTRRKRLIYKISEGAEVTVRNISFTGNSKMSDGDLRGAMSETAEKTWWKIFSSGKFDEKLYEEDKQKVLAYYRANGFRDAAILSDSIWITDDEDLNINITVYEGAQYYIRNIAVTGNEVFTEQDIIRGVGMKTGDVYNSELLELNLRGPSPDFSDVSSLYYDRGYLVNVGKEESISAADSVDIVIRIMEGKRNFFRNIDIAGNTKTKDYVIRRVLYTRPGEPFSRSAIIRSLRELSQLNYFNVEKLEPKVNFVPDASQVDVTYTVEEKSSDTFNASVGYGGVQGLMGSVGVSFNNFDLADPFHGGAGQVMSIQAQFGQSQYRQIALSFSEPWLFQEPTLLGFSVYSSSYNYYYPVDVLGATLSVGRRLRWPDDFFRIDGMLKAERSNIGAGGIYAAGRHDETSFEAILSRNSTDDPLFPSFGSEFRYNGRIAYLPLESIAPNEPANYYMNLFSMKFYTPLAQLGASQKLVLVTGIDLGQLGGLGSTPFIQPTERFVMGGSGLTSGLRSIALRGYDDNSIGDQTNASSTFTTGGTAYMRYVAELRFQISREPIPLFVLAFAEAGNVWTDWSHADPFGLKRSMGVGARIQVPAVGLLGIDLGYGFDSAKNFGERSGWKTHFQFGRFF